MCNAWNHAPGCTCGWGGDGHKGRANKYANIRYSWVPKILPVYESYIIPNASCPVCNKPVFFFQSDSGGRVFFDELGPPWPKHPCTNNTSSPKIFTNTENLNEYKANNLYHWQKNNWFPLIIFSVIRIDKYTLRVNALLTGKEVSLFAKSTLKRHGKFELLTSNRLVHGKIIDGSKVKISIFYNGHELISYLYSSQAASFEGKETNEAYFVQKPVGRLKKYSPPNQNKKTNTNTAMRAAFENAKKLN